MRRITAIALLTWKAAFRFRLFWVLLVLLLGSVVALPLLLKDDGTARGFTQILLTYSLSVITALLGFSTLWLACGTMARDIEERQMQMVAVKPVARWQIWFGKWLGILLLNAVFLAVAGSCVYALLLWRAQHLPAEQQAILRNEVFVARASLKEPPPDLESAVQSEVQRRIGDRELSPAEYEAVHQQIREQIKAGVQVVPSGYVRPWVLDLGLRKASLRDQPLFLRFKFYAAQTNASGTYLGVWQAGLPNQTELWRYGAKFTPDTFHELQIRPNCFGEDGRLVIAFANQDDAAVLFPIEDGFEVLYREGGFGLNYARGLFIVFCWLALLGAMGLAAGSFLSFPVAAFVTASLMGIALSTSVMITSIEEGTAMGGNLEGAGTISRWMDVVLLPVFKAILAIVSVAQEFSPVDSLSTGRSIPWRVVAQAFGQIVLLLGGILGAIGIFTFTRRELATAPGGN